MLRSNQKLMDAEMERRAKIKASDDEYASHVKVQLPSSSSRTKHRRRRVCWIMLVSMK